MVSLIYEPKGRAREYAPLALNLYTGCTHGCLYCYAPSALQRNREAFHATAAPRRNVIEELAKSLKGELAFPEAETKPPVLLCFTCDPYHPGDTTATYEAINLLHAAGHAVHILTKGGTLAVRDFDLLTFEGDAFATTLTFDNDEDSLRWEPNASTPGNRMDAMRIAHERGIKTWASLEPVIDPEQSLRLIRQTWKFCDLYKIGTWNYDTRANEIDWPAFAREAIDTCQAVGVPVYLKKDLRDKLTPEDMAKWQIVVAA